MAVPSLHILSVVTDTFSLKNQGMTTAEAIAAVAAITPRAKDAGIPVSVTLSALADLPSGAVIVWAMALCAWIAAGWQRRAGRRAADRAAEQGGDAARRPRGGMRGT